MTLDEQITILEHNAEYERTHGSLQGCLEFRQLAEWLKDYQRLLKAIDDIKSEIRRFMFEVNPSSSESDYACNYILDLIDKKMGKEGVEAELKRDIELDNDFTEDYLNAVNMAIKALEQEDILDNIRAEIETEKNAGCHTQYAGGLDFALSIIDKYKAESEEA